MTPIPPTASPAAGHAQTAGEALKGPTLFLSPLTAEYYQTLGFVIHVLLAVIVLMFWVVAYLHGNTGEILTLSVLILLVLGMELIYLRGHYSVLPALIVLALICCSTMGVVAYGSVRTVGVLGFAAALTAGGILLKRSALVFAIATGCLVLGGLVYGEVQGWYHRPSFAVGFDTWLMYCAVFTGFAVSVANSRRVTLDAVAAQALQIQRAEVAEREARTSRERLALVYRPAPVPSSCWKGRSGCILM